MRTSALVSTFCLVSLAGASALAESPVGYHAGFDPAAKTPPSGLSLVAPEGAPAAPPHLPGIARSRDTRPGSTGAPWLFQASSLPGVSPLRTLAPAAAARAHVEELRAHHGLPAPALAAIVTREVHDSGRGGILVRLEQEVDGFPVFQQRMNVLLRRDHALVAIGGNLHPAARPTTKAGESLFPLGERRAIAAALSDARGAAFSAADLSEEQGDAGGFRRFHVEPQAGARPLLSRPARVKKVFFPMPDRLVPGYHVEVFVAGTARIPEIDAAYVIAADDGRVLYRADLTAHESFGYRVFTGSAGDETAPSNATEDYLPHPGGAPDGSVPKLVSPALVTMDGFNTGPGGKSDPWLPAGATETTGNNVDAYADLDATDGFSAGDLRGATSSPGAFDYTSDPTLAPDATPAQTMAGITQAFYATNWLHDFWYNSGFDEAAGNAQLDNYGRGGAGEDPLLVETLDSSGTDNAHMTTPADGASPKMQLYPYAGMEDRSFTATPLNQSFFAEGAAFGAQDFEVTAELALGLDGVGVSEDGCQSLTGDVAGKVVLVRRGNCMYAQKAQNAEAAGAAGILVVNNLANMPPRFLGHASPPIDVALPVMSLTLEDGDALAAALESGPVTVSLSRKRGPALDSALDYGIVAHEWGHYLHQRLVFCSLPQCRAESEGWGDFVALLVQMGAGDDPAGAYSASTYASLARLDTAYYGPRRYPYTTDLSRNPLTFRHIEDGVKLPADLPFNDRGHPNSQVHNTGEVWASMLFEGYAGLLGETHGPSPRYTFEEARRRMADYVVLGMKLAPWDPTFTEQRDALLAAAAANDQADALILAKGFAKRGAGSCAVSPAREDATNAGVKETFELVGAPSIVRVTLDDGDRSCDSDGRLDAGEAGAAKVEIENLGMGVLSGASVTLTSLTPGLTIKGGTKVPIPDVAPFGKVSVPVPVELALADATSPTAELQVVVDSPSSCVPQVSATERARIDYDLLLATSATDGFETTHSTWTLAGPGAAGVWAKEALSETDHVWHATALDTASDTALVSAPMLIGAGESFVVSFEHRHWFHATGSGGSQKYLDGAVIEISRDGGEVWEDIKVYSDPGYGGPIEAVSPLDGRPAYVGKNAAWPKTDVATIDLGAQLAGETVSVRFRVVTDAAWGNFGWELDDVSFLGTAEKPFASEAPNEEPCVEEEEPIEEPEPTEEPTPKATSESCACSPAGGGSPASPAPLLVALLGLFARLRRKVR